MSFRFILLFGSLFFSNFSLAQYDPCKRDSTSAECLRHLKSEKCEKKHLPVQDFSSYSQAFANYREILEDYKRKHPQQENILELVSDSILPHERKDKENFDSGSHSNTALRLNWAIDLYKRSKGQTLFLPGVTCATGSHCKDVVLIGDKQSGKAENVNSPYYKGFCGGAEELARRISLLKNKYPGSDEKCLNWIQTHPLVDGEASGNGPLSFMEIGFKENGKLNFNSKNVSEYRKDDVKNPSGDILIQEMLKKDKSEFKLTKSPDGKLFSISFASDNRRGKTFKGMEFKFKYVNGQCMPSEKIFIVGQNRLNYPDIDACIDIDRLEKEYDKNNMSLSLGLKERLVTLFDSYFGEGKAFPSDASTWCKSDDSPLSYFCRTNHYMSVLRVACLDYSEFMEDYQKQLEKEADEISHSGKKKSKAKSQ